MLAARGVSLGLGKINLSDLNQLPQDRILAAQFKKSQDAKNKKPRIIIKKKADAKDSKPVKRGSQDGKTPIKLSAVK
ncbi:hypothetical protein L3Y34_016229 [Caenorhabditis briggsae]|uniref:Uncharacterized protein n=1 Tax=Caenorhabditis briggsae TaxID=6238 RepID=A0AAE9J068_CAEBR|nr:hypothetical protein L3Y34_016229 [Caenorhabditis briggsae]